MCIEEYEYKGLTIKIMLDQDPMNPRTEWCNAGKMVCWNERYRLGDDHNFNDLEHMFSELFSEADWTYEDARAICLAWVRADREGYRDMLRWKEGETRQEFWNYVVQHNIVDGRMDFVPSEVKQLVADMVSNLYVILPLYLYDHSGITMSTSRFSCPWDSYKVGVIYISLENAAREWSVELDWDAEVISNHSADTKTLRQRAIDMLEYEVEVYDQYITGQVYGFIVEDEEGNDLESCWGFFDDHDLKYIKAEAESLADYYADQLSKDFQI